MSACVSGTYLPWKEVTFSAAIPSLAVPCFGLDLTAALSEKMSVTGVLFLGGGFVCW